jgi:hypothetical protein
VLWMAYLNVEFRNIERKCGGQPTPPIERMEAANNAVPPLIGSR